MKRGADTPIAHVNAVDACAMFALGEDDVHVWRVGVRTSRLERRRLCRLLLSTVATPFMNAWHGVCPPGDPGAGSDVQAKWLDQSAFHAGPVPDHGRFQLRMAGGIPVQ